MFVAAEKSAKRWTLTLALTLTLAQSCSDGGEDQGAEEAFWGRRG